MITRQQFIDAVIDSCQDIFEMMQLPLALSEKMFERPLPFDSDNTHINGDILALLGLTGTYSGVMQLNFTSELALKMASWMMQTHYSEFNSEVLESIGELANMIAGGLKNRLSTEQNELFNMSIPLVVSGKDKSVYHGTDKEYIFVPIETQADTFFVILILDRN